MAQATNLYLLIFPERGIIKIGKADDIHNRIQSLRRWWGEVDYEASYYLASSLDVIFKLERSLHFLLSQFAIQFNEGDGRTELFSSDALDIALKHIDLYCSSTSEIEGIKKGVPHPPPSISSPRRRSKYAKLFRRSKTMTKGVTRIVEQFGRINRLLIILLRRQSRIAYQYDVVDDYVYFRVRLPGEKGVTDSHSMMHYFHFDIEDFYGWCGINCCSVVGVNDVVQYKVQLLATRDDSRWNAIFSYFFHQSEILLRKLPQRSSAATSPIPMIDESQVLNDLFERYKDSDLHGPALDRR